MYFTKPSLRTKLSFEIGMKKLGGNVSIIKQDEIILGERESIKDSARVISQYADAIVIRTFAHSDVETFDKHSSIPVINALTDLSHPCQVMADFLTIKEQFNTLSGLKIAYVGDWNNVANSLMVGCAILGINFAIVSPSAYQQKTQNKIFEIAKKLAEKSTATLEVHENPYMAVKEANVIYTDTWVSMGQENDSKRKEDFQNYQINANLMTYADKNAIVLHCLPAYKGEEITEDIFEQYASVIFNEAANRMYAQMAILASIMRH